MYALAVDLSGQMYGGRARLGGKGVMLARRRSCSIINTMTAAATEIGVIADASSLGVTAGCRSTTCRVPCPLSLLPRASTTSAVVGQSVAFTATVSDLSAGGATPNGGTVTFSDQSGALDSETLVDGVATFTTSSLAAGTYTVTASYGGTADFAPSSTGTIVTVTISPGGPVGGTAPTRTVLTAQPRPVNLGRPVTLTATVKDLKHRGPTPIGSVTFLDGTAILGTAVLRRGKGSLKTSSLPLGPNTIQAYYIPGQGFAPSTASVVENVRAHRSRSKAAPSAETGRRAVPSTSVAIRVGRVDVSPVAAVTIVGGPTVLGPIEPDPGRAARGDGIPGATRHIRTAPVGTDNAILGRRARRKQDANQLIPATSNAARMRPSREMAV